MNFDASQMTSEELQAVIAECEKEMQNRKRQFRARLIDNFEVAFRALRNNGISVRYTDHEQEAYRLYIDDFDNFDFGD